MTQPATYPEELAKRTGFKPYNELTPEQHTSIWDYCNKYYDIETFPPFDTFYWKESSVGDGNWISFDVSVINRTAAPHLKE